jgi:Protein of unknown function (DUF2398)
LTDVAFPRGGTLGHAALLTIAELANVVRPATRPTDTVVGWVPVPPGALGAVVHGLLELHGRRWRNEYVEHPDRLVADVEDLLLAMRLLRRGDGRLELSAVARRYAPDVDEPPARSTPPALDFDEVTP